MSTQKVENGKREILGRSSANRPCLAHLRVISFLVLLSLLSNWGLSFSMFFSFFSNGVGEKSGPVNHRREQTMTSREEGNDEETQGSNTQY